MSDFFHDPTNDDQGDTFTIHSADGWILEISPSCLRVRDTHDPRGEAFARVPLNLDRIEGVAAGAQVTVHCTHAHELVIRRERGGIEVTVRTPHHFLLHRHLMLPTPEEREGEAKAFAAGGR